MKNLITEHLDIWTSAKAPKSNGGRGNTSTNGQTIYGIKKLRELILELAVRGKLVPQDPNDLPANELLKKITKEKERLLKEGKIKKQKPLPEIGEGEKPFDLPKGWQFARLNDFGDWGAGATPLRNNFIYYNGSIPWFKSGELESDFISESEEHITELALRETSLRYNTIGDVLIAMYGATIGKVSILQVRATTNQAVCACTPFNGIYNLYLLTLLKAYKNRFIEMGAGGAQPNISREKIIATVVPLPPLNEQHRIVAKVDELMALCDQLEKQETENTETHQTLVKTLLSTLTSAADHKEFKETWNRIKEHFDILFTTEESIDQLKQTILQLAVMGKLVEQDPNDLPASELLKKIAKEKEKLIKEGKIKKQKPLPEISEDEKSFELPEGWEWVKVADLGVTQTGTTPPTNHLEYYGAGYPFIKPSDILYSGVCYNNEQITELGLTQGRLIPANSALMVCIGGSIGKVGYINRNCSCNQQINAILPLAGIEGPFIAYWMKSPFFQQEVHSRAPKTTLPILSKGKWEVIALPLPPLNEQHRIVAKVDELMALCETLKSILNSLNKYQINLAKLITERVAA